MMPSELGELMMICRPAKCSSSVMNDREMKNVMKLRIRKTFVAQRVDLCLQYWKSDKMIEFMEVLACQAKFLPSVETSKSWSVVEAQAPWNTQKEMASKTEEKMTPEKSKMFRLWALLNLYSPKMRWKMP